MSRSSTASQHQKHDAPPARRPLRSRFRRDQSGVAAIEFAFIAIPFFFLVFAIIETALVATAGVVLENSVDRVARMVLTGQVQEQDLDFDGFKEITCEHASVMMSCDRIKLDVRTYPAAANINLTTLMKQGGVDTEGFCFDPGTQDTITVVRAYYEWPFSTNLLARAASGTNGNAVISAMSAFMNEPFGDSRSNNVTC